MSDASANNKVDDPQDFSLRQYDIRALICLAATGTALGQVDWQAMQYPALAVAGVTLLYTIVSYWFIKSRAINPNKAFDRFTTADAAVIGAILNFASFDLLPTILLLTMIQFNSLINGGLRKWALDNTSLVAGIALSAFLQAPKWHYTGQLEISSISLIGIIAYFCSYALYAYKKTRKMENHIKRLANEHTMYKLRTYKLSRYLPPTVWKAINEGREKALTTERKRVTVFFSDIQGFSALSEELEAEALTELLNSYLTEMARIATKNKGTIDKFIGDAVMVIFGDSKSEGVKTDCLRAVTMAIEMRRKMQELQQRWYEQGIKKPLLIRMGLNSGFCTVGSFGTSHYMDYTVLGTHVNLASRLESAADAGEILISHDTWTLVKDVIICRDKGEINVKGFAQPVRVYQVVDFRKDLGKNQSWFEENIEGFSMHLDLERVRNYDRDRVIEMLQKAGERLRETDHRP